MAITQETHWDNVGTEPGAGDAEYVAGQQPISEHDNWFNWSAAKDVENLIAALENVTTGHDHDGANSKQVGGSDVMNTPAGNIVATDVQAAINELDTEKETPTGAQTKVNTHAADTSTHGVAEVADKATVTAEIDSDISTHAALTASHGVTGTIQGSEDKNVANGIAGLDASALLPNSTLQADVCKIASGSYTGNDTANRAIPHGLGATPKLVMFSLGTGAFRMILKPGKIDFCDAGSNTVRTVTESDGTNFYVGNASNYTESANGSTFTYYWVAFA